jgi:putative tricarboxylic transport membrane protein
VPGSAPAAVLMAAMMIHDINPGPMLMVNTPEFFYQIVAMLVVADMAKLLYGLFLVRPLLWILLVPRERLMPSCCAVRRRLHAITPSSTSTCGVLRW